MSYIDYIKQAKPKEKERILLFLLERANKEDLNMLPNNIKCILCGKMCTGTKRRFCSMRCAGKHQTKYGKK
jgi:hypothetical protein